MTVRDAKRPKSLLVTILSGLALLLVAAAFYGGRQEPSSDAMRRQATAGTATSPHMKRAETLTYVIGYGLALALTAAAFGLVWQHLLPARAALYTVLGLGFLQMLVHFRCFLHVDLRRNARADLQLLLFSTLIVALMVGGTLVILFNLHARMMGPS